jgi:hypothetical protein
MPVRIPRRIVTRIDWPEINRAIQNLHDGLDASVDTPGFFGAPPVKARPTVTGSRGGNAALASLLSALANLGLIRDTTTP